MTGCSAEEIARSRPVGLSTIRSQIASVLRKLGVRSQHAAAALTYRSCVDSRVLDEVEGFINLRDDALEALDGALVSSGGNLVGSVIQTGVMPLLPVNALLARNVVLDWSDDGELAGAYRQRCRLGHEIRWGPFRLTRAVQVGGHIDMPDPQLIGYVSELLPRCPDPDPRLRWPQHATALLR